MLFQFDLFFLFFPLLLNSIFGLAGVGSVWVVFGLAPVWAACCSMEIGLSLQLCLVWLVLGLSCLVFGLALVWAAALP